MNVTSGGPHILLFERDQQLTTLLSSELMQAGYEVHTARTAVEVFDAIARFPIRLVMVDLAQAQAGRREFWVALDAQRRGRGVQVFTFRCTNLGGYGPDDPDERIETVLTDLEVDGPGGIRHLLEAVRSRVPGAPAATSAPPRQALVASDAPYQNARSAEVQQPPLPRQVSPVYQTLRQASPVYQSAPMPQVAPAYQPAPQPQMAPPQPVQQPVYQSAPIPQVAPAQPPVQQQPVAYQPAPQAQPLQGTLRPQPQEVHAPPPPPARPAEPPRSGHSTFTDKIRAVFYPSSQSFSAVAEASASPYQASSQPQQAASYPDVQPRPRASQRLAEAEYQATQNNREEMIYQSSVNQVPAAPAPAPTYSHYADTPASAGQQESGLDQLTRMLRESQPTPQSTMMVNGQAQNFMPRPGAPLESQETLDYRGHQVPQNPAVAVSSHHPAVRPGLTIDPQEIQDFRSQILQAARQDEAYERSSTSQARPEASGISAQLRASPIQDVPFEQEIAQRKVQAAENLQRPAMAVLQPTQVIPQTPSQPAFTDVTAYSGSSATQPRPAAHPETPVASANTSQLSTLPSPLEASPQDAHVSNGASGTLNLDSENILPEEVRRTLQQSASRRPEVKTSDDMLLDIVKSLPPMSPAPQPPQPQVLNGRATRSLGSVLLEGHLVPQERLQVAQHVQRMMRGVDLNYQLGEILLMFKLLTPDQLLAASLVSYGMISTVQISALGRIRQELHAMGLEYDLESLLVLFRILTPEQLREVRASWSS
jgi:CheY-like chemotaxis protein